MNLAELKKLSDKAKLQRAERMTQDKAALLLAVPRLIAELEGLQSKLVELGKEAEDAAATMGAMGAELEGLRRMNAELTLVASEEGVDAVLGVMEAVGSGERTIPEAMAELGAIADKEPS